jgi:HEAT repeat protein
MTASRVDCPALHCWGDHLDPAVREVAGRMFSRAPAHAEALAVIALNDADGAHRAAAIYLLAMANDLPLLLRTVSLAMRDPNSTVRNNSLRVLADVVSFRHDAWIGIDPILDALQYPSTTDRNKAAAVLDSILRHRPVTSSTRKAIVLRAGRTLTRMLRLQQPNNHQFAHAILIKLSGVDFGEHNYIRWEKWIAENS